VSQPDREQAVSRAFVALADTLVDDYDIIDMLDRLVAHSVALLAADAAGILLGDPHGQLRVLAASSEDAALMELLQLQNEQGPCLDCYHTGSPVSVPNLANANFKAPSPAASSSNRPKECSPNTTVSAWTSRSTGSAATAAPATCAWPKSPANSPPANSTQPPSPHPPRPTHTESRRNRVGSVVRTTVHPQDGTLGERPSAPVTRLPAERDQRCGWRTARTLPAERRAGAIQVRASCSTSENLVSVSGRSQRSAATRAAAETAAASTSGPMSP
jgi:hypothetical protein